MWNDSDMAILSTDPKRVGVGWGLRVSHHTSGLKLLPSYTTPIDVESRAPEKSRCLIVLMLLDRFTVFIILCYTWYACT